MTKPRFRPDIEGMRAVAILLVVGYHAGVPGFAGGYIGVDVFFVLSGYLITGLLVHELEESGRLDLSRFYSRRARRLLPAAALVLLATLLIGRLVFSPLEMRELGATALATSVYASNLYFLHAATDYLAAAAHENPLLHTWSLAVEEQFYLVWPLLIVCGYRLGGRAAGRSRLIALLAGVTLLSFAGNLWFTTRLQPWAFFGSPFRAWEFAMGGLAVLLPQRALPAGQVARAFGWTGLGLIGIGAFCFDAGTAFPGWAALLPVGGTLLALVACARAPRTRAGRVLSLGFLQRTGALSYSWYLWHWPVLVFAADLGWTGSLAQRVAWAAFALWLSSLTYRFIENPVRHHRLLIGRPAATAVVAVLLTLASAGWSGWWFSTAAAASRQPDQMRYTEAYERLPANYTEGCHVSILEAAGPRCVFGDSTASTTVVVFGDSHAAQWLPALDEIGRARGWRVVPLTKSECPAVSVELFLPRLGRAYTECAQWREWVFDVIAHDAPALVVTASSHAYLSAGSPYRVSAEQWREGMAHTLGRLRAAGTRPVVLRDTPRPGFVVPLCLARASWSRVRGGSCDAARSVAVDTLVWALERTAAVGVGDVALLDLNDVICGPDTCEAILDGIVVYKDSNHLSAAYSEHLADALDRRLSEVGI